MLLSDLLHHERKDRLDSTIANALAEPFQPSECVWVQFRMLLVCQSVDKLSQDSQMTLLLHTQQITSPKMK